MPLHKSHDNFIGLPTRESLDSIPPKNIIDNHSRLRFFLRDLRKHTRNGHLGKVPGGFEPWTPGSPVQRSNH